MILALDQGTTGTTAIVFDRSGRERGRAYRELHQHFPSPGQVEHDPEEIWASIRAVGAEALAAAAISGIDLDAIGITNQRETVVAWDRHSGEAIHPAIVWQDRRTAERCEELRAAGLEPIVRQKTGLVCDPYFTATKIEWLRRNVPASADAVFGTIDSWLLHRLCGVHRTDYTNASRTMLFDISRLEWDEELCAIFGIDAARLPEPVPSIGEFGVTTEFGGRVPVTGVAGDQQAALFGQACTEVGDAKCTYGTGNFILVNAGNQMPEPKSGLLTTLACAAEAEPVGYALEASIFVTGAAIQWLRDGLGIIESAADSERLAASLQGNDGVYFVPALTGLGSPYWDPEARGTIVGLTRGCGRAHLARAALESIAFQTADAVRAQEEAAGLPIKLLKADGGATANQWLMRFQADVLGVPVAVPEVAETTALGAAFLAGIGVGSWTASEIDQKWREAKRYEPSMQESRRGPLLKGWADAVGRSRSQSSRGAKTE